VVASRALGAVCARDADRAASPGRSTSSLAMNLQPNRAGCVFGLAMLLPAIPFVVLSGARDPLTIGLIVVAAMGSGVAFALGATVAGRPHSPKSIILALLGCWSFFSSINWLAGSNLPMANPRLERAVRRGWLRRERGRKFALATLIGRHRAAAQARR
jgi:hypothetical protein